MELLALLWWLFVAYLVVQIVRLAVADGDLTLLWAEKFGKNTSCLRGRVVWIVGSSSGIGEYLAYELAKAGCRLVLSSRRHDELARVKKQCLLSGQLSDDDIFILPMDVLQFDKHQAALDEVIEQFGHVDFLVNNAGRSQRAFVVDTPFEVERQIMELNYFSLVSLTKIVLPHMIGRGEGQIVVTSSIAGKLGAPFSASYSATKFALHGFFDALRIELYSKGIGVILTCPGPVFSGVERHAFSKTLNEEYGQDMKPDQKRMNPARCAELMVVAMANKLPEVWISRHPPLLFTYIFQYMPTFARWLACKIGVEGAMKARQGQSMVAGK